MANYTGQLLRRDKPEKPLNTEAIGFVLQSKENKWNANQAKIDSTLSQLGSIELLRDKDKEHLLGNVQTLLGNISNAGSLDLSSDSVSRGLENTIIGAIDDEVINQVVNTRKIKSFNSGLQTIKEKNPELYNQSNHAYAIETAGLNQYMSGDSDAIGNLEYTPYTDVSAKVQKGIKDLREYNKESEVEIPINDNGVHRILTKKVKDLNEVELRGYVMSQLGSQERGQLQIDGWSDFRGYDNQQVSNFLTSNLKSKTENLNSNISILSESLKNAETWQKSDIQNRINILNQEKAYIENSLDTSNMSRSDLERLYKEQQLVDNITATNLDVGVTYSLGKTDSAYYDEQKRQLDILKFRAEEKESTKTTPQSALDSGQLNSFTVASVPDEEIDPEEILHKKAEETNKRVDSVYTTKIKDQYKDNASFNKYIADNKDSGKSERELFQNWSEATGNEATYEVDGQTRLFSQDSNEAADIFASINNTYKTSAEQEFETNIDEIYDEVTSEGIFNNNQFPVIDDDGKSIVMTEYLEGYSKEDFKNNKDGVKDTVKKNLYLNKAFSNIFDSGKNRLISNPNPNNRNNIAADTDKIKTARKYLQLAGEELEDYFNVSDPDPRNGVVSLEIKNNNATAWRRSFDRQNIVQDVSIEAEGRLSKIIGLESNGKRPNELLQRQFFTTSAKGLSVRPNRDAKSGGNTLNDVYRKVQDAVQSNGTGSIIGKIDDKTPILIQENPNDPDYVIVSQEYEYSLQGQKMPGLRSGTLLKRDLEDDLGFELKSVTGEQFVNNTPVTSKPIRYIGTDTENIKRSRAIAGMIDREEIGVYTGEVLPGELTTKSGILKYLGNNGSAVDNDKNPTEGFNLAKNIINSPSKVSVEYEPDGNRGFVKILDRSDSNNPVQITAIPIEQQNIKIARNTTTYSPQSYLAVALRQMVMDYRVNGESSELYQKFQNAGQ